MKKIITFILTAFSTQVNSFVDACEKKFTLGMITSLPSTPAQPMPSGNGNGSSTIQVNVNNNSAIDQSNEPILDPMSTRAVTPSTLTKRTTSDAGVGAAVVIGFFLNEDSYNLTVTDNGAGAGTVVSTYSDGWVGLGYNNLAKSSNSGRGIMCYGFSMVFTTTAGAQDSSGLANANPSYITVNNVNGGTLDIGQPLNEGIRNTQFQVGTMTVLRKFFMSAVNQISYNVPVASVVDLIVFAKPTK